MGADAEADRPRAHDDTTGEVETEANEQPPGAGAIESADSGNPADPPDPTDQASAAESIDPPEQVEIAEPVDDRPPVDRALSRIGGALGGRPLSVYGVLLAGAAVLFILLAIIWLTSGGGGGGDRPTCQNIELAAAIDLIEDGQVDRVRVTYADERANLGPILLQLDNIDETCRILQPQGVQGEREMLTIIGLIDYRNRTSDDRRIDLSIDPSDAILSELLWTPTVPPTATFEPTATVPAPPTATDAPASPTAVPPTNTPAAPPTATTPPTSGSPGASPDASPAGTPRGPAAPST